MKNAVTVLGLMLLLVACSNKEEFSGNPIVEGWYADPEGVVFDNEYWIYPTLSDLPPGADSVDFVGLQKETRAIHQVYNIQTYMDAFSSKDMVHWTKHPKVLSIENIKWLEFALWAPSVVQANGKYYLFFGGNDIQNDEQYGGIGVAIADHPAGPFKDALGKPLIDKIVNGAQPIDQFVFKDDDGSYYMYYGGWHHCNMVKLSPDLLSLVPFDDGSYYKSVTPENYVEGPFMLKRNNKYPVYLRVRVYNRETKVPTNIEVDKNGWDIKRREPKDKSLKIVLSKKILGLESYLNNCMASDTELSIELVKDFFATKKHVTPKQDSFYDYYLAYVERRKKDLNKETIRVYMTTYNVLKAFKPKLRLSDINLSLIEGFDEYMRVTNGNADGGRYPKHKNLKTVLLDMQKHDIPVKNPYPLFKMPQPNVKEVYLDKEELDAFRKMYVQLPEGTTLFKSLEMYLFSCYCGLRISDVVTLKWSEVDLENGLIVKMQVKTKEEVKAPIFEYTRALLLKKSNSGKLLGTDGYVFGDSCIQVINRRLKELAEMAGVDKHITFHSSRHTFATLLVMDGVSIYKIQKFLGHKSVGMTERYLKYDLKMAQVNMEQIDTFG